MNTRLSKIARLPANIREQLNRRLHDGDIGRTILPWVNNLPETKKVLDALFHGKPITHQNLSEWRYTGYQDWLLHQQRLDWFDRLSEQEGEITKHNRCDDSFEAMASVFLFEIGQALNVMRQIKNPNDRCDRLQNLSREFVRLQNAFNRSRRVCLEWDKYNDDVPDNAKDIHEPETSRPANPCSADFQSAVSPTCSRQSVALSELEIPKLINSQTPSERQGAGALPEASRSPEAQDQRASVLDCGSPLPLSDVNSETPKPLNSQTPTPADSRPSSLKTPPPAPQSSILDPQLSANPASNSLTPKLLNSQTPPEFAPIPTYSPTTPPPPAPNSMAAQTPSWKTHKVHSIPIRGRRFTCIEG